MLNFSKIVTGGDHQPNLSLNLSAISVNQSVYDTTCANSSVSDLHKKSKSKNFEHIRSESLRGITKVNHRNKKDKSMDLSFINDANMITKIFDNQTLNKKPPAE